MDHIQIPENLTDHPEWGFEKTINSNDFSNWCSKNMSLAIYLSLGYVIAVFAGQKYMEDKPKFNLRKSMMLWSLFLAVFSAVGAFRCTLVMYYLYMDDGIEGVVCGKLFYLGPIARFWGPVFVTSKILEYMDTAFIVLRKQKLIFLHWYHHLTVSLFSWYTYGSQYSGGGVFMTVNLYVHAIMYSYYAVRAAGYKLPKPVAVFITASQIIQMVVGSWTMWRVHSWQDRCDTSQQHVFYGSFMYLSYLVLFCNFFYNTYLVKQPRKNEPITAKDDVKPTKKSRKSNNNNNVRKRVA